MQRIAFITGATSGIGWATAQLLARHACKLILCGRREDRLDKLQKELSEHTEVATLSFDIRVREDVLSAIRSLDAKWQKIDILINNAGNAHGLSPIQSGELDDWDAMLDINVKGLLYVTRGLLPGMVARNRGHIINLGSIAGKEAYPNGNVYCATKFAVDALTRSMRLDLNGYNIKVTAINPGLVETEFSNVRFKGDAQRAKQSYEGLQPLTAEDVAEFILFAVTRPPHVVLADLMVLPLAQASTAVLKRSPSR